MRGKRWLALLCAAVLLALCCGAQADEADLEKKVTDIFKRYKTVGAALVVMKDGEVAYQRYYGYSDRKQQIRVDEDDCFRIASVTKMLTGIHVMQLVEQGLLDLDEPIGTYLGYTVRNPYYKKYDITLRMIMSHTSSLKGSAPSNDGTLQSMLDVKKNRFGSFKKYPPGSKYTYSNFGGGILGALIEAASGKSVQDSAAEDFFGPLNVTAAYHPSFLPDPEMITNIYKQTGAIFLGKQRMIRAEYKNTADAEKHWSRTVGSMWVKPADLARIGQMMLNGGTLDGVRILKEETVAEMCSDQNGKGGIIFSSPYGLCVNRIDNLLKDRMVYGHQGMFADVLCNLYWEPQSGLVFAMVTNGCNNKMSDHIGSLARKLFAAVWDEFGN